MSEEFKSCPCCGAVWETQEAFINDGKLELNGYMADFEELEFGLFYFTHKVEGCGSTMVLEVGDFMNLYDGPRYDERRTDKPDCPKYCRDKGQLSRCNAMCECAFAREVCAIIKEKQSKAAAELAPSA